MANFKHNEEGVSAVIGVILMVAITVILAAVIAAFVFQLGNQLPSTSHTVGVQVYRVSTSPGIIAVKTLSGDVTLLTAGTSSDPTYTVTVGGVTQAQCSSSSTSGTPDTYNEASIGSIAYFPAGAAADVTVVAHYSDGTSSSVFSGKVS